MQLSKKRQRALLLFKSNKLLEAKALFEDVCGQESSDVQAWHMLGAINGMLGLLDDAERCCRKVIKLQPGAHGAHVNLGNVLAEKGRTEESITSFRNALKINPNDAQSYTNLGNILRRAGRMNDAVDSYKRALSLNPKLADTHNNLGALYIDLRRFDSATDCLKRAIALAPGYVDAYINMGKLLLEEQKQTDAIRWFEKALEIDPRRASAYIGIGSVHKAAGDYEKAVAIYMKALEKKLIDPDLHFNYAVTLHEMRNYSDSARECQTLLNYLPDHVQGLLLLAANLQRLGNVNEAIKCCELASTLQQDNPEPYLQLGRLYSAANRTGESEKAFVRALKLDPDNVRALSGLALTYRFKQDAESAVIALRKAIDIDPKYPHAYNDLGIVYKESGKYPEAEQCFRTALDLDESLIHAWINLGFLFTATGEYEESLSCFQKALAIDPSDVDARTGEVGVLFRKGNTSAAYDRILPLIKTGSTNPHLAAVYAELSHAFDCENDAVRLLRSVLDKNGLTTPQKIDLHYAFGKLLDKKGEYADSFKHYRAANELRPASFDQGKFEDSIDLLISVFSKDNLNIIPQIDLSSELPVFIVGMPRSGTSLVEQIISSHSSVYGAGELKNIHQLAGGLGKTADEGQDYPGCMLDMGENELVTAANEYIDSLRELAPDALRVIDKMPGNFIHLGLIDRLFPKARVIHCIRDPLDTCLSCYFQNFSSGHDYSYRLDALGLYYQQYKRLMSHWSDTLTIPVMEVRYENLVERPEEHSRSIIEFCGLEWEDQCLEFYKSKRVVVTASYDQVRRPIYSSSIARWRNYENFIEPLREVLSLDSNEVTE